MPQIPDLWGRVLTAALGAVGAVIGALIIAWVTERRAASDAAHGAGWRRKVIERLDAVTEAQHVAMRQQLLHNYHTYVSRGGVIPEERQAWYDMYVAYTTLGGNGYMDGYWKRLEELPDIDLRA